MTFPRAKRVSQASPFRVKGNQLTRLIGEVADSQRSLVPFLSIYVNLGLAYITVSVSGGVAQEVLPILGQGRLGSFLGGLRGGLREAKLHECVHYSQYCKRKADQRYHVSPEFGQQSDHQYPRPRKVEKRALGNLAQRFHHSNERSTSAPA